MKSFTNEYKSVSGQYGFNLIDPSILKVTCKDLFKYNPGIYFMEVKIGGETKPQGNNSKNVETLFVTIYQVRIT